MKENIKSLILAFLGAVFILLVGFVFYKDMESQKQGKMKIEDSLAKAQKEVMELKAQNQILTNQSAEATKKIEEVNALLNESKKTTEEERQKSLNLVSALKSLEDQVKALDEKCVIKPVVKKTGVKAIVKPKPVVQEQKKVEPVVIINHIHIEKAATPVMASPPPKPPELKPVPKAPAPPPAPVKKEGSKREKGVPQDLLK